jgi:hypothetical protein
MRGSFFIWHILYKVIHSHAQRLGYFVERVYIRASVRVLATCSIRRSDEAFENT